MVTKLHLVMPMAGRGSRFQGSGFAYPKPLIEIYGKPFFYWAARSISKFHELASIDFVVLREHVEEFGIDGAILRLFPDARIHVLPEVTEGAVVTCLKGVEDIGDSLPVVFNDCDHLFRSNGFHGYCMEGASDDVDGILLTFPAEKPIYSFVEKDRDGNVVRTAEKEAISHEAICGCYYFRSAGIFAEAARKYLSQCGYSEYFMSGVYNVLLEEGHVVRTFATDFHIPFGTPEEYANALHSKRYEELL